MNILINLIRTLLRNNYIYSPGEREKNSSIIKENTPEGIDLLHTLDGVNISGIYAVQFLPYGGASFNVKTERMRKISKYVVEKLGKMEFAPLELESIYKYVKSHLPDELPEGERKQLEAVLGRFVESGGKVIFISNSSVIGRKVLLGVLSLIIAIGIVYTLCGGIIMILSGSKMNDAVVNGLLIFFCIFLGITGYVEHLYEKDTKDVIVKSKKEQAKQTGKYIGTTLLLYLIYYTIIPIILKIIF